MRQNIWVKITAYFMLLLLIISFGIWGIADYLGYIGSRSPWVAKVNGDEISQEQVIHRYNQTLQNLQIGTLSEAQARDINIFNLVIDNIVNEMLIEQKSEELGISMDIEIVKQQIMKEPNFINPDNNQFDPILFSSYLRNAGMSENYFVQNFSKHIKMSLVEGILKPTAPPSISKKLHNWDFEQRKIEFVQFPPSEEDEIKAHSESELVDYYNSHLQDFTTQKHRSIKLIHLSFDQAMQEANIEESTLIERYEQEKERFTIPARAKVDRILFDSLQEAQEAHQIADSQNLSLTQVASRIGKEVEELGFIEKNQGIANVNEVIFSTEENSVSEPIELPIGYALIWVSEMNQESVLTFEDVKILVEQEIRAEKANDVMYSWSIDLEDGLAAGNDLLTVSNNVGVELLSFDKVTSDGHDAFTGETFSKIPPAAVREIFELDVGEISRVIEDGANGYFVVKVEKETQASVRKFEDVKPLVITAWTFNQRMNESLDDVIEKARHLSGRTVEKSEISKIAEPYGVSLRPSAFFTRNGQRVDTQDSAPLPSLAMMDDIFLMEKGHILIDLDERGPVLVWLDEVVPPDSSSSSYDDEWNRISSLEALASLRDDLRQYASISYNQDTIESLYDNLQ